MDDNKKTLWFVISAIVLTALAFIVSPSRITPEAFIDQGEAFFPDFTDPNEATTLEVIDYNFETGEAIPFKVTFESGKWTIPSHYNYPADGQERLAKTAAAVIQVKKDDFRSSAVSDQENFFVVDPLDENAALEGRGQRITIKGKGEKILADLVLGKPIDNSDGFRFVRVPGQSRVYAAKTDIDISTRFEDWIESDLLKLTRAKVNKVIINDYTINERTISVNQRDRLTVEKDQDGKWKSDRMKNSEQVDEAKMNDFLTALTELKIVDVRPKPEGLSESLKESGKSVGVSRQDQLSLQNKGFYFSGDGRLLANEGEMLVYSDDGVAYSLRFGEIVFGGGTGEKSSDGSQESRYLFIAAYFDSSSFAEPKKPSNFSFENKPDSLLTPEDKANKELSTRWKKWERDSNKAKELAGDLNDRFAEWYYVISSRSFDKLRIRRSEIVIAKTEDS